MLRRLLGTCTVRATARVTWVGCAIKNISSQVKCLFRIQAKPLTALLCCNYSGMGEVRPGYRYGAQQMELGGSCTQYARSTRAKGDS